MKYLIAGLGNIGEEYKHTRHNIGFLAVDKIAAILGGIYEIDRHAFTCEVGYKGRKFVLIKPTTYMNASGKAVAYHLQKNKLSLEQLLVITDDLAIPFGTFRLRKQGSDGGHNGLKDINAVLNTTNYARLRMGIGANFHKGRQVDYVLGDFNPDEKLWLEHVLNAAYECVIHYVTIGADSAMTKFNKSILPE